VVAVEEADVIVMVEDTVERGNKTSLKLELIEPLERELAAPLEGELTALVGLGGMVAIMLRMGFMAKMSLELLQQARLPGPWP
jgi:hypothetical protein